jgi:RimJ/RimL family protein N-acetyltransferase
VLAEGQRALATQVGMGQRLLARVHLDNVPSQRLFESAGYVRSPDAPDELGFVRYVRSS